MALLGLSPEATVTFVLVWKQGILKSLVSHVLNFKSWIQLIYEIVDICNFVMLNPTVEGQNMGNKAFQNASFETASFGKGNEDSSYF